MSAGGPRRVSLRRRFLLILGLAVVALLAAALALLKLRAQGASERARVAFEHGDATTRSLARRLGDGPSPASDPARLLEFQQFIAALIAPLVDASAGYCTATGELVLSETAAPTAFGFDPPPHHFSMQRAPSLLPLDRDVLVRACRTYPAAHDGHVRFAAPNDLLFITISETPGPLLSWALIRMPNRSGEELGPLWGLNIALLGLVALALVVLTADALLVLRRGSDDLQQALGQLQLDLRAVVPRPRAEELARLADGLRSMASHLAEAHERERALERRLGHEQRLAGLGRVVAGVAHEIRNPLAGMKLKMDGLARRRLDERSSRDVAVCLQEIARLDRVVSSLLLVARRGPVDKQPVELAPLVRERIEAAQPLAGASGVRLLARGEARVLANREHLARVLDNLLRNAVEASPPGGAVEVILEATEQAVTLQVLDQGAGVPPDREAELFEPFFTLKAEGTGLGLFLSRALADAHGGHLVYRRDGDRTCFELSLPAGPPDG